MADAIATWTEGDGHRGDPGAGRAGACAHPGRRSERPGSAFPACRRGKTQQPADAAGDPLRHRTGRWRPIESAAPPRPEPRPGVLARIERPRVRASQRPRPGRDRERGTAPPQSLQRLLDSAAEGLYESTPRAAAPSSTVRRCHARLRTRGGPAWPRDADADSSPTERREGRRLAHRRSYRESRELHVAGELFAADGSLSGRILVASDAGRRRPAGLGGDLLRHHRAAAHADCAAPGRSPHDRPRRCRQRRRHHGRRRWQGRALQ